VAVVEQTFSNAASHVADANKAKSGIFFAERVHFTLLPFEFTLQLVVHLGGVMSDETLVCRQVR